MSRTTYMRGSRVRVSPVRDALLEALVSSASKRAYRIAHDLLRNVAEAEDAVQDSLALACESFDRLRDHQSAEAWFLRIVTRSCLRRLRRRRIREAFAGRAPDAATVPSCEETLSGRQDVARLLALVQKLPTMQRVALTLRYGHDLSVEEIARLTDTKPSTTKTHLVRGLRRLRDLQGEDDVTTL
jgi:RNA polymerase sigma-70 factor (ECF subfamily)